MKTFKLRLLSLLFLTLFSCKNEDPTIDPVTPPTPPITPEQTTASVELTSLEGATLKGLANDGASVLRITVKSSNPATKITITPTTLWGSLGTDSSCDEALDNIEDTTPKLIGEGYDYYLKSSEVIPDALTNSSKASLQYNATITTENDEVAVPFSIEVVRTALILAHGLASDSTTFKPTLEYIDASNLFIDEAVYALSYKNTSLESYDTNLEVVPLAIDHTKNAMLNAGYLNQKVTLMGHSMGGILGRLYLQGDTYRDDLLKLICVDCPHSGSQLADFATEIVDYHPDSPLAAIGSAGAIIDLQVDSEATLDDLNGANLNRRVLPTHIISASFANTLSIAELVKDKEYIEAIFTFLLDGLTRDMLYQEENDIVVPLSSQQGGIKSTLTKSYITHYTGVWHCTVYLTEQYANDLIGLCDTPSTDNKTFTVDGFNPPVLTYTRWDVLPDMQVSTQTPQEMAKSPDYSKKLAVYYDENGYFTGIDYAENGETIELSDSDAVSVMAYNANEKMYYYTPL